METQPAAYRTGLHAWGYERRGTRWIPNRADPDRPDDFELEELVEMHLRCRNIRRELAVHPTIRTIGDLARAVDRKQHSDVSKPLNGFTALTDDTFAAWVAAFGNTNLEPTAAEKRYEFDVAKRSIETERRAHHSAPPSPVKTPPVVAAR